MRLGIIVNHINTELAGYTTTHLAITANNSGHEVWYIDIEDLIYAPDEKTYGYARRAPDKKYRSGNSYLNSLRSNKAHTERVSLDELDVLLLRNNPADDINSKPWARLAGINFARLAMRHGVIVLNDPNGLARAINKMYLQSFPVVVRPRILITRNRTDIIEFIAEQNGWAVLKPLAGSGGRNVFLVNPDSGPNINQMIDAVANEGYIIVQQYLPNAAQGDIRMFLMNGVPLQSKGHYAVFKRARNSADRDFRNNITAGAHAVKTKITDELLYLADILRPQLIADGMFLVGLDIVENKLMEINVFSPGGLVGLEQLEGVSFTQVVIRSIEQKVEYRINHQHDICNRDIATL